MELFFLPLDETQKRLRGLENVARASVNIGVSRKWVKLQFWVNYPFKVHLFYANLSREVHGVCGGDDLQPHHTRGHIQCSGASSHAILFKYAQKPPV